jgi:uncharacterized protein YpmB
MNIKKSFKDTGKKMIVWIGSKEVEKIERISREQQISMSEVIRQAIKKLE